MLTSFNNFLFMNGSVKRKKKPIFILDNGLFELSTTLTLNENGSFSGELTESVHDWDRNEIMKMLKEIQSFPILLGVRGEKRRDIDGVIDTKTLTGTKF